ncbi:MAG: hypothetical protein ACJA1A_002785 [Saprospiraceae bacterium]|jgi:hypothetical protein
MAKFRTLTLDELQSMEKEFVDFLVVNGIPGDDWIKLKNTDPKRAEGICEAFSDVVFTKILKNCKYIERHASKQIVSIFCDENKMFLMGLDAPNDLDVDFTDKAVLAELKTNPPKGLQTLNSEKEYSKEREVEIWEMLNDGFFISDQKLYMALFS